MVYYIIRGVSQGFVFLSLRLGFVLHFHVSLYDNPTEAATVSFSKRHERRPGHVTFGLPGLGNSSLRLLLLTSDDGFYINSSCRSQ